MFYKETRKINEYLYLEISLKLMNSKESRRKTVRINIEISELKGNHRISNKCKSDSLKKKII